MCAPIVCVWRLLSPAVRAGLSGGSGTGQRGGRVKWSTSETVLRSAAALREARTALSVA